MKSRKILNLLVPLVALTALIAMACGATDTPTPIVIEKEVIKEVIVVATPTPTPEGVMAPARMSEFRAAWSFFVENDRPPRNNTPLLQAYDRTFYAQRDVGGQPVEYIPELFTKWEAQDGGKRIVATLQEGVQFHEGWGEHTAEDVEFMLTTLKTEKTITPRWNPLSTWDRYDINTKATGKYEVEVTRGTGEPLPMVDWLWGMDQFYMGWSKDYWKAKGQDGYASHPIGTGPFHFIKWGSGSLTYERVEDHWRSDPIMDRAVFVGTSEAQTRAALVQTGGAHISDVIPLDMAQDAEKAGVNLVVFPGFFNIRYHFGGHRLDPWNDPWADPKVRKAIALAVDVDAMSEEFWGGHAIPLVAPVATSLFNAEPYGYDPEEAKRLLAEAGYPNGFEVEVPMITVGGNPRVPLEHNSLLTFLENIGLKVKGTVYDWTGGWSQRWGEGDTGGMIFGFSITRFDSAQREWDWYGRTPRSIWQDATLTDILTRMDQPYLTDLEEFDKLQVEAWHYLYDIVGVIPLYATPVFDLLSGDLTMPKEVMTPQRVRLDFIEFAK